MMVARTLIKNRSLIGGTPSAILNDVNNQLCEGNVAELFVTVWLGIIEISTGKGLAVNAGHEHPALRRKNGEFALIEYRHSPAVAAMEDMRFKEHEFKLEPGDTLFLYTDGVAEANNSANEFFGTDRMLDALNKEPDAMPEKILNNVLDGIHDFVKGAEQFDDITMLAIKYFGTEER
jgi:sigma-B regulation protein RsbU (phosphoserine phosphatase)